MVRQNNNPPSAARPGGRFIPLLVMTCIACALVILAPQFLFSDWRNLTLAAAVTKEDRTVNGTTAVVVEGKLKAQAFVEEEIDLEEEHADEVVGEDSFGQHQQNKDDAIRAVVDRTIGEVQNANSDDENVVATTTRNSDDRVVVTRNETNVERGQEKGDDARNHTNSTAVVDDDDGTMDGQPNTTGNATTTTRGTNQRNDDGAIVTWDGLQAVNKIIHRYFGNNLFCETVEEIRQNASNPLLPVSFNITFGCDELFHSSGLGTGNFVSMLYSMRLATQVYDNVDLRFECHDALEKKDELILPWVTGQFSRMIETERFSDISIKDACGNYITTPMSIMYKEMQYDLRRMAIGLVGASPAHPSMDFAEQYLWSSNMKAPSSQLQLPIPQRDDVPPYPKDKFRLDDAVIHFRCGDLMFSNHPSFGFMKFSGYTRHISPEARSIGILTQPFNKTNQSRKDDAGATKRKRCQIVVMALVDYIQERHPKATVRIHNGPEETIALAYARMVMANQTIVGISSFGVFPGVASFGTGYIRKPDYRKAPNRWLLNPPIQELTENVILIEEPKILCGQIKRLWQAKGAKGVLSWFRDDDTETAGVAPAGKDDVAQSQSAPVELPKLGINETVSEQKGTVVIWEGLYAVDKIIQRFWKGNLFCETVDVIRRNASDNSLPVTFNISFGCDELFNKSDLGTGNYISLLYALRLATQVYNNVALQFQCHDALEKKDSLILPWLTGRFSKRNETGRRFSDISTKKACGNYDNAPISVMHKEMQYDLRRMAIGLVGTHPGHPSMAFADKYLWSETKALAPQLQLPIPQRNDVPPYPKDTFRLDDAVIHFRCGDLMFSNHPSFGFMKFSGYTRHISPEASSIGILTQPFNITNQTRQYDQSHEKRKRCQTVVMALVDYIQERHPKATVQIHNGPEETIALAYARMVMANQTIVGISSFGVFPAIASFGTAYIQKPDYGKAPNKWLLNPPIEALTDNVILIQEPRIICGNIKSLWQKRGAAGVLEWFSDDSVEYG